MVSRSKRRKFASPKRPAMTLKGVNEAIKAAGINAEIVRTPAMCEGAGVHHYQVRSNGKTSIKGPFCRRLADFSLDYWIALAKNNEVK